MKMWFCSDYCYFVELGKAPVKVGEPSTAKKCATCGESLEDYAMHFYATKKELANVA